jgi:succinate-semialdehyde dehydrogenase/glutarate-semialdehyde dehydrogenase
VGRVDKTPKFGDNAPIIVFDDADIEMAVKGAIASKYRNAGQTILVQDGVYDAFAKRLAEVIGSKGSRSS